MESIEKLYWKKLLNNEYSILFSVVIVIGYSKMSQAIEKEPISILFPITKIYSFVGQY